ncbi:peptide/nickel transport system permease protein [Leeuwenhoekiella aestuarii]|uniref:ABC transporter permease n=1 Tax=Leeuwenhoekiella aestuarii TaxID=2249426 RepID=UPI000FFEE3CC|nr:ABC transporter permease [Leeuwenhoekiella aestuarii]RXG14656.1 peptide/nickel transport system permease protein [Leeuwenhoekiella aestuarii]
MAENASSLTHLALRKFKRNFWGVLSFTYIVFCGLVALFAYLIAPDHSRNANQMHLAIHSKKPGFTVKMLTVPGPEITVQNFLSKAFTGQTNTDSEIPITSFEIRNHEVEYIPYSEDASLELTKAIPLEDFGISAITTGDFEAQFITEKTFLLGTDKYGRDLLSRMLIGARISFSIGFVAVLISLIIGVFLGAVGGYYGGKLDAFIMWIINVTWSIPTLLLVIAITLALGKGFWQVFIAVGLTMWVEVARVVRGQVLSVKEAQYVTAARALGYKDMRILFKHILPNILAPVIVISAANFASAILIESGLSFLGIGAQPPVPSWGAMIKDHYSYIILGKAYLAIIPGLAIMSLVMAFMLMGNALRDALDVKGVN